MVLAPSENVCETPVANASKVSALVNVPPPIDAHIHGLLSARRSAPKPAAVFSIPANLQPQNPHYILETGRRVAARFTPQAIVEMLGTVIGLWQNAIYLGVSDRRLWVGIDWSWDMLLTGLAISVGRPELVPRPQAPVVKA